MDDTGSMGRPGKAVLVFDGECAFCAKVLEWIRARMDAGAFDFIPCQSDELINRFPGIEREACLQAMHLVLPDGSVRIGERAIPHILRRLPRYRWCASFFDLPGADLLSRAVYRRIAKYRHRAAGNFSPVGMERGRKNH